MSDIFQEVEEAVRQDRYVKLWKRYHNHMVAAAIGIVVVTAGVVGFRHYQESQRLADSRAYAAAARQEAAGEAASAAAAFAALAERGGAGYPVLARLRQAAALGQQGDVRRAVEIYDQVAAKGGDRAFVDLAHLRAARLLLDSGDAGAARDRLERPGADGAPWQHLARELKALALLQAGDSAGAADLFKTLAEDTTAPGGLRGRARDMLTILDAAGRRG
ncbi:MAG: tetratricopeptide repeat protein [Alphaproteobacteria bacterium]|nr:tetratricopeptide repeat protein [Alphaproteobacteria bacterium]